MHTATVPQAGIHDCNHRRFTGHRTVLHPVQYGDFPHAQLVASSGARVRVEVLSREFEAVTCLVQL